jgi:ribosomal protein S20
MKKILILGMIFTAFVFTSCQKEDANKDVETAISQLKLFNQSFDEYYEDGVISKDTLAGDDNSEYDKLKKLASNYYETINNINKNVQKEVEMLNKGKKIENYDERYQEALKTHQDEIDKHTAIFEENLSKIE